jgi:hypothetical protein
MMETIAASAIGTVVGIVTVVCVWAAADWYFDARATGKDWPPTGKDWPP